MGMLFVCLKVTTVEVEKSLTSLKQAQLLGLDIPLHRLWKLCGRLG